MHEHIHVVELILSVSVIHSWIYLYHQVLFARLRVKSKHFRLTTLACPFEVGRFVRVQRVIHESGQAL